jgi:hypothetical protein
MTLLELARSIGTEIDIFVRLRHYGCISIQSSEAFEHGICVNVSSICIPREDLEAQALVYQIKQKSILEHLELYYQSILWGDGPKIFRPTAEQLFALEQMNLNIEIQEMHLPFPMIAIELPEAYRVTKKDDAGNIPHVSLLYKEPSINFFAHDLLYSRTALKAHWCGKLGDTVENWLDFDYQSKSPIGMLETTLEEYTIEAQVRRAVLNYCLLLDEVGIKNEGPAVPNQYAQLVKWCEKKNAHTNKNKRLLRAHPTIFGLAKAPTSTDPIRQVG